MLTEKDFKAIAEIVLKNSTNETSLIDGKTKIPGISLDIVYDLADYFISENSRFDRDKFLKTCGF